MKVRPWFMGLTVIVGLFANACGEQSDAAPSAATTRGASPPIASPSPVSAPVGGDAGDSAPAPITALPPVAVPPGAAILEAAATWSALVAGNLSTSFDHSTTTDILVRARLDPTYAGHRVALNFLAPSGGTLAGYVDTVSDKGVASFDVKLAGTFVGRNQQTGTFQLALTDLATASAIASQVITLTAGAQ